MTSTRTAVLLCNGLYSYGRQRAQMRGPRRDEASRAYSLARTAVGLATTSPGPSPVLTNLKELAVLMVPPALLQSGEGSAVKVLPRPPALARRAAEAVQALASQRRHKRWLEKVVSPTCLSRWARN